MRGAGGSCSPCALAPFPGSEKILMVIHSGKHKNAKVCFMKGHFCKTTQISVIISVSKYKKQANLELPLNVQKLKLFQLQGGKDPLDQPSRALNLATSF